MQYRLCTYVVRRCQCNECYHVYPYDTSIIPSAYTWV